MQVVSKQGEYASSVEARGMELYKDLSLINK